MKVLSFFNEEWEKKYLSEKLGGHQVLFLNGSLQDHPDLEDEDVECLSVFIKSHIGAEEMNRFPKLRSIVTRSTGYDHIDVEEAKKRGISVSNVPTYGENTVAEYTFALLLALSRRIYESYERVLEKGSFDTKGLDGFDLLGKKIGIVGTGHIGQHMIRMAKGFGMEVIAFDVHEDENLARMLGFMYVTFDDLLSQSDIISLHAPYNAHTHHMINMDNISTFKQGAYILNTARGGLIETRALISGLESGHLAGAGLDVVEEEGFMQDDIDLLMGNHPNPESLQVVLSNQYLIDHPRVLIMPHNAFNTREAMERILETTIKNIQTVGNGAVINTV